MDINAQKNASADMVDITRQIQIQLAMGMESLYRTSYFDVKAERKRFTARIITRISLNYYRRSFIAEINLIKRSVCTLIFFSHKIP